jgi:cell division protein FtsZ
MEVNDFIIVEVDSKINTPIEKQAEPKEENQMLMFDMPLNELNKREEKQKASEQINEYEVRDSIEIMPVTEVSQDGVKRYRLDDYQKVEDMLMESKAVQKEPQEPVDDELVFEKRTEAVKETIKEDNSEADPMNSSITDLLKKRTEERKQKMKAFNYKFNNSNNRVDELEKQPAYKRLGIELDNSTADSNKISRTTLSTDENDEIQLRNNNSFLHDNVD